MGEGIWVIVFGVGTGVISWFSRARFNAVPHRLSEAGIVAGILVVVAALVPIDMRPSLLSLAFAAAGCLCFGAAIHFYTARPVAAVTSAPAPSAVAPAPPQPRGLVGVEITNSSDVDVSGMYIEGMDTAISITTSKDISARGTEIRKAGSSGQFALPNGEFAKLSNSELRDQIKQFGAEMRASEAEFDKKRTPPLPGTDMKEYIRHSQELDSEKTSTFKEKFSVKARSFGSEILSRIGNVAIDANTPRDIRIGMIIVQRERLILPHSFGAVAEFLDFLADKLPAQN